MEMEQLQLNSERKGKKTKDTHTSNIRQRPIEIKRLKQTEVWIKEFEKQKKKGRKFINIMINSIIISIISIVINVITIIINISIVKCPCKQILSLFFWH